MISVSVIRKSIPVSLESESGVSQFYIKEMTGAQRDEFLATTNKKLKVDPNTGEVVGMNDYKGMYSTLLSFCLYDADGKLVPEASIQAWPDSAQRVLFDAASVLNGLKKSEEAEENAEKN